MKDSREWKPGHRRAARSASLCSRVGGCGTREVVGKEAIVSSESVHEGLDIRSIPERQGEGQVRGTPNLRFTP